MSLLSISFASEEQGGLSITPGLVEAFSNAWEEGLAVVGEN